MSDLQIEFPGLKEQIDEITEKAKKQNEERKAKEDRAKISKALSDAVKLARPSVQFGDGLEKKEEKEDIVNHPKHYNREGAMQCLDEMELVFGTEAVMHFCLLNSWKYRYRAADKNGAEDIAKSDFYINYYKELKDKLENKNNSLTIPVSGLIKEFALPYNAISCGGTYNDKTV